MHNSNYNAWEDEVCHYNNTKHPNLERGEHGCSNQQK